MLLENHQSMAVVIDEYSGTYGVLTCEDFVREIFGPISDEYKPYARRVEVIIRNKHNFEISGLARLVDLNEQLNINLISSRCETLGGFICEVLGKIPTEGDNITCEGFKFTVTKMDDKRIATVWVKSLEQKK